MNRWKSPIHLHGEKWARISILTLLTSITMNHHATNHHHGHRLNHDYHRRHHHLWSGGNNRSNVPITATLAMDVQTSTSKYKCVLSNIQHRMDSPSNLLNYRQVPAKQKLTFFSCKGFLSGSIILSLFSFNFPEGPSCMYPVITASSYKVAVLVMTIIRCVHASL